MANEIGSGDRKDFDETRRLLYMALLAPRTKRYNLAGTLVNALLHHHAVDVSGWEEVAEHVVGVLEHDTREGRAWVEEQIDRITGQLGD